VRGASKAAEERQVDISMSRQGTVALGEIAS
jgi:hypothetical protein